MNTIIANSTPEGRQQLLEQSEELIIEAAGAGEALSELLVALDEILTNIAVHGYAEDNPGPISMELEITADRALITICDQARPFDPTAFEQADQPPQSLAAIRAGGLGIRLVIELIDNVEYGYANGNRLTLRHQLRESDHQAEHGGQSARDIDAAKRQCHQDSIDGQDRF